MSNPDAVRRAIKKYEADSKDRVTIAIINALTLILSGSLVPFALFTGVYELFLASIILFSILVISTSMLVFNNYVLVSEIKNLKKVTGYKKDSEVYRKAMIDRRLFHNIISKKDYQTRKNTAILLALALELNEEEAKDFLSYAGYAFSNTRKDLIILHCIRSGYYNIMQINAYLYDKGLNPLLSIEE